MTYVSIVRWVEFPTDATTFTMQDEYLVGSSLLVKPITKEETFSTEVYLPGDDVKKFVSKNDSSIS